MDYYDLREWRSQNHQSNHSPSPCTKIPRLHEPPPPPQQQQEASESSALPLFLPEPPINSRTTTNLSAFTLPTTTFSRFNRNMIGLFSLAQWEELELQALIFKYILAGLAIPSELLQPIKKSITFTTSPFYLNYPLQQYHHHHYQPAMLQSGYWGRTAVDPEPGRCRRTDGKKWRCSRDVVTGQKYCERHVHRGRNRSRKPVEISSIPSSSNTVSSGSLKTTATATTSVASLPISAKNIGNTHESILYGATKSDGQVLRHFFDDWPKPQQQSTNTETNPPGFTTTGLSISIEGFEHHQTSDFSLKLSTGVGDDEPGSAREGNHTHTNWLGMSSMRGGPLAEALQSSINS